MYKSVHDRAHDAVQIACMATGTGVAMHACTEAVTAHVVSRRKSWGRVN
jgi:hypothetical protein